MVRCLLFATGFQNSGRKENTDSVVLVSYKRFKVTASESCSSTWKYWWTMNVLRNLAVLPNSSSSGDRHRIVTDYQLQLRGWKAQSTNPVDLFVIWQTCITHALLLSLGHFCSFFISWGLFPSLNSRIHSDGKIVLNKNKKCQNATQLYTFC